MISDDTVMIAFHETPSGEGLMMPLPCPFCGSEQLRFWITETKIYICVQCKACSSRGPMVGFDLTPETFVERFESVIKEWNRRGE